MRSSRTLSLRKEYENIVFRISPKNMLIIMAAVIFMVETLVMFILSEFPPISRAWEAMLDSTILLLLLSPFYLYVYRPFWREHQKQARQIRFLSQQLLKTSEEESARIARDIHDQCGQTLTALQFGIQVLRKQLTERDPEILSRIDTLEQAAAQLSGEFRSVTSQVRPTILDEAGLISALNWQLQTFRKNYPNTSIDARIPQKSELGDRLDDETENAVYRICQEGLTNIARHAEASEVTLILSIGGNGLELKIEDNGRGFDVESCLEQKHGVCGVGLLGMRERALMVDGSLQILSSPGSGTRILAAFPIHREYIS